MYKDNYIGNKIKFLRKNSKLTLQELASKLNSSSGYLSDIERGNNIPSIPKLVEICSALGITLKEFFDDDTQPTPIPEAFKVFIEENKDLTPEQLKNLSILIKSLK